jgi:hypothetical protein
LSDALADTVTLPLSVAPAEGAVMLTVGGVRSLSTVMLTLVDVAWPAASRAVADTVWAPLATDAVFQERV